MTDRRFPPPWTVERLPGGFKVVEAGCNEGQSQQRTTASTAGSDLVTYAPAAEETGVATSPSG
jgi:hypothetical protein